MTSVDVLIDAIITEAHETAEKIIQDAKEKALIILEEHRKKGQEQATEEVHSIGVNTRQECTIEYLRKTADAELKAKWMVLEKEHALVNKVLNDVKEELSKLIETNQYIQILENLIVKGGISLGSPYIDVLLNTRDSSLPIDLNKLADQVNKKTGRHIHFTKTQYHIDTIGGVMLQTTDGKIVLDNTFEGIMKNSKSEIRYEIGQILFANEEN